MPDQVPFPTRKERNALMQAAFKEASRAYQVSFTGRVLPVLWESVVSSNQEDFEISGLTGNYIRVNAHASQNLWNRITPVRLNTLVDGHVEGSIIQE
jgi:tRNA A37 methylthiotransferase MiaB